MIYILLAYISFPFVFILSHLRMKSEKRIVVFQTAKIGDLICSTPVFREIKKKYCDAHLVVIVNPITKELLEYNPYVDEVISIKNTDYKGLYGKFKLSRLILKGKYDIAICLNPNVPFTIASLWGLVPTRLSVMPNYYGITFKLASVLFTSTMKHTSQQLVTETYMKMLEFIAIESTNYSKEVYQSDNAITKAYQIIGDMNRPLIGIAISSGNKLKELGTEKIIELVNMFLDQMDTFIVLIGSNQDKYKADAVLHKAIKKERVINSAGKISLKELPALIDKLSIFIGVDTGILYMADALSIPIIHIAGPIDTSEQRPIGRNVKIIQRKLPCVPCTYVFKAANVCRENNRMCVSMLDVNEIFKEAEEMLKSNESFARA